MNIEKMLEGFIKNLYSKRYNTLLLERLQQDLEKYQQNAIPPLFPNLTGPANPANSNANDKAKNTQKEITKVKIELIKINRVIDSFLIGEPPPIPMRNSIEFIALKDALINAINGYQRLVKSSIPPNILRTLLNSSAKTEKEAYYKKAQITKQDTPVKKNPQLEELKVYKDSVEAKAAITKLLAKSYGDPKKLGAEDLKLYNKLLKKVEELEKKEKAAEAARKAANKPSLKDKVPANQKSSKSPEKVNKQVKDIKEKASPATPVSKNTKGSQVINKTNPSTKPTSNLTSQKSSTPEALATTRNTTNIFTGKDPIAQLVSTPTQLLDKDFTDFRVYEASSPFFSGKEYPAYIKLMDDSPTEVDFADTLNEDLNQQNTSLTSGPPSIENPFRKGDKHFRYNKFTMNTLIESSNEKYQIVDSTGAGFSVFGFGEKIEIWSISGELINDKYNNWLPAFREVWKTHIRLEKLIENKQYVRIVVPSQRIAINCYPIMLTIQNSEQREMAPPFSMAFIVRDVSSFYASPFGSNSASEALIKNLMHLDGVEI